MEEKELRAEIQRIVGDKPARGASLAQRVTKTLMSQLRGTKWEEPGWIAGLINTMGDSGELQTERKGGYRYFWHAPPLHEIMAKTDPAPDEAVEVGSDAAGAVADAEILHGEVAPPVDPGAPLDEDPIIAGIMATQATYDREHTNSTETPSEPQEGQEEGPEPYDESDIEDAVEKAKERDEMVVLIRRKAEKQKEQYEETKKMKDAKARIKVLQNEIDDLDQSIARYGKEEPEPDEEGNVVETDGQIRIPFDHPKDAKEAALSGQNGAQAPPEKEPAQQEPTTDPDGVPV